jgi:hypothetical protein
MEPKQSHSGKNSTLNEARYVGHLTNEENDMLNIIADIIVKYVLCKGDELNVERKRQEESNQHYPDSE